MRWRSAETSNWSPKVPQAPHQKIPSALFRSDGSPSQPSPSRNRDVNVFQCSSLVIEEELPVWSYCLFDECLDDGFSFTGLQSGIHFFCFTRCSAQSHITKSHPSQPKLDGTTIPSQDYVRNLTWVIFGLTPCNVTSSQSVFCFYFLSLMVNLVELVFEKRFLSRYFSKPGK